MASKINKIYFSWDLDSAIQCKKKIFNGHQSFPCLAIMISKSLPLWSNDMGLIMMRELLVQETHWLRFVSNHLLPSINDQDMMIDWVKIIGCIMH